MESNRKLLRDYGIAVVLAVVVALLIRFFVIEAYRIPTVAMRPTLEPGDTVFVGKWSQEPPARGDLILYSPEEAERRDYIKRVVGIPGDVIQIRQGRLLINQKPTEQKIPPGMAGCGSEILPESRAHGICLEPPTPEDTAPVKVPPGHVFVLGDLRTSTQIDPSTQGKSWGLVPLSTLKGKVLWIWLSVDPGNMGLNGGSTGWFPKFRFERMFQKVE